MDDLSFTVRPGSVTGFLGPNGSGKSTTLRMITGLDFPDVGYARIDGRARPGAALATARGGCADGRGPVQRRDRRRARGLAGRDEKHGTGIFGKLGLPPSENDNRRVLAVLRYLGG